MCRVMMMMCRVMCRDVPCHDDDVPCHDVSFVSCYCEEDADWRGVVLLKKSGGDQVRVSCCVMMRVSCCVMMRSPCLSCGFARCAGGSNCAPSGVRKKHTRCTPVVCVCVCVCVCVHMYKYVCVFVYMYVYILRTNTRRSRSASGPAQPPKPFSNFFSLVPLTGWMPTCLCVCVSVCVCVGGCRLVSLGQRGAESRGRG